MQNSPFPLRANSRLPYAMMSAAAPSPLSSFADPSTFSFPSKLLPSLSRQSSMEPSYVAFFSAALPSLSRHASLSTFPDSSFDSDPFNFPAFDEAGFMVKADVDSFDLSSRVSSFDSDVSSWSSIASDDSGSAPRSPQSSVDSMSDSSHSDDAEHLSPYTSSSLPSYPVQDHWVQPHFQRQATSILLKEEPQVTLTSSRLPHSPVPVLPLPFNPPVYAFNYHSAEDEPTPQPHSSRHERREGLRGGGDSRQELQRSYLQLQSQGESGLYSASAASSQPAMTSSTAAAAAASDAISPKSLLLSLRTAASSHPPSQPSHQHSQHYSPSSSSSHSSSSVTSIHLSGQQDPNEVVVGIYTRAERAAKIARYREKRANRQWRKKILYGCRKSFADNRPRVGGRFIKMKPAEGEEKETRRK